jgi:ubiquitin-conjugating enzyme E2 variant
VAVPIIEVAACVLVADFLSGFFHWLEDAYGQEHWPITGRHITRPNIRHHRDPGYFTRHAWLETARVLLVLGTAILLGAWALGALSWQVAFVVAIGVNANEIHKWAHRSRRQNGRLISLLQDLGVLQSAGHHARHHRETKATHYCVVTNYLNPLLERIHLWAGLERMVYLILGVCRRPDHRVTLETI